MWAPRSAGLTNPTDAQLIHRRDPRPPGRGRGHGHVARSARRAKNRAPWNGVPNPNLVERYGMRVRVVVRRRLLYACPRADLRKLRLSYRYRVCVSAGDRKGQCNRISSRELSGRNDCATMSVTGVSADGSRLVGRRR